MYGEGLCREWSSWNLVLPSDDVEEGEKKRKVLPLLRVNWMCRVFYARLYASCLGGAALTDSEKLRKLMRSLRILEQCVCEGNDGSS